MATATNAQKIAGLYAAFFNRAPDAAGLAFWEAQFTGTATVNTLAVQFAANPVFTSTYGSLTDVQFVNAVYQNVLGAAGDAAGVDYWVGQLKNGGADARANFVAQFVNDALTVDVSTFTGLTAEERAVAQTRQDTLTNKANVGLYFAEKLGTASNITTTGDITLDPAYKAAQAALSNVNGTAASVSAAEGRIDIAVGTSDPAGSLVGQNSALTAALVDLQTKTAAELTALKALATADNAADAAPKTTEAGIKAHVDSFTPSDALPALQDATGQLATAKANAANAEKALVDARASTSDATLKANVTTALNAVNADATAKGLYTAVTNANAASAATTDVAVLTSLKGALSAYVTAGGATSTVLAASVTVGTLLDTVNGVLALKVGDVQTQGDSSATPPIVEVLYTAETIAAAQKALVESFLTGPNTKAFVLNPAVSDSPTASETAVINAITAVETRDKAYATKLEAEKVFTAHSLGQALRAEETKVTQRDALIKNSTDTNAAVTKETADLAKVQAAFDAHATSQANVTAAQKVITDLGYVAGDLNTGVVTADKDLFVANTTNGLAANVIQAGFATGDELFIGTQYKFGGATTATTDLAALNAAGSSTALEVFFQQVGTNTVVHIETKAFANASADPSVDTATITLTGVTASTLTFENGFVHVA